MPCQAGGLGHLPCVLTPWEPAGPVGEPAVYTCPEKTRGRLRWHCPQPACTLEGLTLQSPSVSLGVRPAPCDPLLPWQEQLGYFTAKSLRLLPLIDRHFLLI